MSADGASNYVGDAVDMILGQADEAQLEALRARTVDPEVALEVAETRDFVERFREVGASMLARPELRHRLMAAAAGRRQSLRRRRLAPQAVLPMYVSWAAAVAVASVILGLAWVVEYGFVRPANTQRIAVELYESFDSSQAPAVAAAGRSDEGLFGNPDGPPPESPLELLVSPRGEVVHAEWSKWMLEPGVPAELPVAASEDLKFHQIIAQWATTEVPGPLAASIDADNTLAVLRQEFRNRFTPTARRRALRLTGGNPEVEIRVQALADVVAERVDEVLRAGANDAAVCQVQDVALALRALLAAGSDTRIGDHRSTVQRCAAWMEAQVLDPALPDAELAVALAALSDVAVCTGAYVSLVGQRLEGLAERTLSRRDGTQRPGLLRWTTAPLVLGDAGRVFRLAPAFGVPSTLAYRARMVVAAHLEERLAAFDEDPALLAAQRYGFDDLVDRDAVDQKLRVWRATFLKPDYVAMHHLAWSQYPVRPGWARFQRELLGLAALDTPEGIGNPSALLLCLAMNFAAPGISEILGGSG